MFEGSLPDSQTGFLQNLTHWAFNCLCPPSVHPQAAELAEYNSKLTELAEAKRMKEMEVDEWQHKVRSCVIT